VRYSPPKAEHLKPSLLVSAKLGSLLATHAYQRRPDAEQTARIGTTVSDQVRDINWW
jgi:hypothetical protein